MYVKGVKLWAYNDFFIIHLVFVFSRENSDVVSNKKIPTRLQLIKLFTFRLNINIIVYIFEYITYYLYVLYSVESRFFDFE